LILKVKERGLPRAFCALAGEVLARGTYVKVSAGMASLERRVAIDAARAAGQL